MPWFPDPNLTLGLDFGSVRDHTFAALVERVDVRNGRPVQVWRNGVGLVDAEGVDAHWIVRGVRQWPVGIDYSEIVAGLVRLIEDAGVQAAVLRYDATGVGRAVRDLLRAEWRAGRLTDHAPIGVTLTAGQDETPGTLPKKDLVAAVGLPLMQRRLHVAAGLADADQLRHELESFRVDITKNGREVYESASEKDHDDSITALGLAMYRQHEYPPARAVAASYFHSEILTGLEESRPANPVRYG